MGEMIPLQCFRALPRLLMEVECSAFKVWKHFAGSSWQPMASLAVPLTILTPPGEPEGSPAHWAMESPQGLGVQPLPNSHKVSRLVMLGTGYFVACTLIGIFWALGTQLETLISSFPRQPVIPAENHVPCPLSVQTLPVLILLNFILTKSLATCRERESSHPCWRLSPRRQMLQGRSCEPTKTF